MTTDQSRSYSQDKMGVSNSNNQASEGVKPLTRYYDEEHISRAEDLGTETVWSTADILLHAIEIGLREFEKSGFKHSDLRQDIREDNIEKYESYLREMLGKGIDFQEAELKDLEKAYEHLHGEDIREMVGRKD